MPPTTFRVPTISNSPSQVPGICDQEATQLRRLDLDTLDVEGVDVCALTVAVHPPEGLQVELLKVLWEGLDTVALGDVRAALELHLPCARGVGLITQFLGDASVVGGLVGLGGEVLGDVLLCLQDDGLHRRTSGTEHASSGLDVVEVLAHVQELVFGEAAHLSCCGADCGVVLWNGEVFDATEELYHLASGLVLAPVGLLAGTVAVPSVTIGIRSL